MVHYSSPVDDHGLGQSHTNSPGTLPERSMVSEASNGKSTPDEASATAQPWEPHPKHEFEGHINWILRFVFLHDIVSSSLDCDTRESIWTGHGTTNAVGLVVSKRRLYCQRVFLWSNPDSRSRNCRSRGGPDQNEARQGLQSCIISPLGDEIASGGENSLCIWDSNTGELLVGLIEGPNITVGINLHQVVWFVRRF